jgi:very-short-patch-repair endonuclease
MTVPEVVLWNALRGNHLGARFRRQHPIGAFVLDFYCPQAKVAVEVDGAGHADPDQAAHDHTRARWLNEQGIRVLRFAATDVMDEESRASVLAEIEAAAAPSTPSGSPSPAARGRI